jgi:hypothetical protein
MKLLVPLTLLASFGLAQMQIQIQLPAPPVIQVSAGVQVSLVPTLVVVERQPEPQGVVVVYQSSQAYQVYRHHDRDLERRGWVRTKYRVKGGVYVSEYRRGKAKARLEVQGRQGRVRVRIHEG